MRKTANLNLNLPEENDFYNIGDFNQNSEILDNKLAEINNKLPDLQINTEQIKAELRAESEQLINKQKEEVEKKISEAVKSIADSKGESITTFNPDGSIVTVNSLETIITNISKADKSVTSEHKYKNGLTKTLKTVFEGKKIITTEVKWYAGWSNTYAD